MKKLPPLLSLNALLPWEQSFNIELAKVKLPTTSIVIPIFNAGNFLEKTLRSLLCNDLNGVEIILMDGGSNDDTMKIVNHYKEMFYFIFSGSDNGQSHAINNGFSKANGRILYWLNGDDILLPNTLNHIRNYFHENTNCHMLVGNAYMTEIDFSPINHFKFDESKLTFEYILNYSKNHLIQPSVFFSREAWEYAGPLNVNDHYAMDADLFIGIAKKFKIHHINIDIAYSVYHEECKTRSAKGESITALALVQAKYGALIECKNTLDILVRLFNETGKETIEKINYKAKIKSLEFKLANLTEHLEKQKDILLKIDLEMFS